MAGFIEFALMRTRGDIDQKYLSELYYQYMNVEEDFVKDLFYATETKLGRVFVQEPVLTNAHMNHILDYERASHIVDEAERMTVQAQNALLKTLEEPPQYAVIMLLTENAEALLPTIRSRCVMMKLRNIKDQLVKKYLMEQMEIPDYKADVCVAFAQGNMGKAIMLATSEYFNEIKEDAVHLLRNIDSMSVSDLMEAVKHCMTYKLEIGDYLDVIAIWYRDVLIYKATKNVDRVVFSDQLRYIRERASKSSYEGIENILDGLDKAKSRIKANVNLELAMELLLLTIKEN